MKFNKIFTVSDIHFGVRNNSISWCDMMVEFFDWFIKDAKSKGLDKETDALFILGDIFNSRESINVSTLQKVLGVFNKLKSEFFGVYVLTGNHDTYYIDSNDVTTISIIDKIIPEIKCYYSPEVIDINGHPVFMLPWITSFESIQEELVKDDSEYLFCHMDINGMKYSSGIGIDKCVTKESIAKYKKVFSGHIHLRQDKGNVLYVGSPYQLDVSDGNSTRGYYIINADTFNYEFVENEVSPKFKKLLFSDVMNMSVETAKSELNNNYIELFVRYDVMYKIDLIRTTQKLSELGITARSINYTEIPKTIANEEDTYDFDSLDFNIQEASEKMLKDMNKSQEKINSTMDYFLKLYDETKNERLNGVEV